MRAGSDGSFHVPRLLVGWPGRRVFSAAASLDARSSSTNPASLGPLRFSCQRGLLQVHAHFNSDCCVGDCCVSGLVVDRPALASCHCRTGRGFLRTAYIHCRASLWLRLMLETQNRRGPGTVDVHFASIKQPDRIRQKLSKYRGPDSLANWPLTGAEMWNSVNQCLSVPFYPPLRERQRDRETERQRDKETDRQTHTHTHTEREREREREREN